MDLCVLFHTAEISIYAILQLPVLPADFPIIQQRQRGSCQIVGFFNKTVFHQEFSQLEVGHDILRHDAAVRAVGMVNEHGKFNCNGLLSNDFPYQPFERCHLLHRGKFGQLSCQSVELVDVRLLVDAPLQVIIFLTEFQNLQIGRLARLQPQALHHVQQLVVAGGEIQFHVIVSSVGGVDVENLSQGSSPLPAAAYILWGQRRACPSRTCCRRTWPPPVPWKHRVSG